jgi:hypothetical protein
VRGERRNPGRAIDPNRPGRPGGPACQRVSLRCWLDFGASFYFDRSVPADDQVTSLTGVGPAAAGQNGAVVFTTTHWSVVLEAQGPSPAAQAALDKLCRTYWRPIYGFVRRQGIGPEEAEDLTQGFFALLLERRDLDAARKEKGRLRSYLLTSLKHFLANEHHRAVAIKRGEGQRLIPLDQLRKREHAGFEPADTLTACCWQCDSVRTVEGVADRRTGSPIAGANCR